MSWNLLSKLDLTVRPLTDWPGARTPDADRQLSRFDSTMGATVEVLARELRHLDAARIVLQVDLRESQLRLDGLPRSDARAASPGVVLGFDSEHGPLRYACDRFVSSRWSTGSGEDWQHNLRAVALGLEALRKVDRYGISKRGEQYRGYAELPAGIAAPATHMTKDDARRFVFEHADLGSERPQWTATDLGHLDSLAFAYRRAARHLHPDAGGDAALFQRLQTAKQLLEREGGR